MAKPSMSRMVSFFVLVGIIVFIGIVFFRVMVTFFVPLFLAGVLVVLFRPMHHKVLARCQGRRYLAGALTTGAVMLVVLAPAIFVFALAAIEGTSILASLDVGTIRYRTEQFRDSLGLEMPLAADMRNVEDALIHLSEAASTGQADASEQQRMAAWLVRKVQSLGDQIQDPANSLQSLTAEPLIDSACELAAAEAESFEYDQALQVATREFRELKLALCGGPYRAWAVDLANPSDETIRGWTNGVLAQARGWLLSVGGATTALAGKLILGLIITVISLFFFLVDGPQMTKTVMRLSPLDDQYEVELLEEFDRVSRAVVLATLLSAVVQGLLGGIGYWLAGLDSVFLLMLLTTVMAMVPIVGTGSIWAPVSLWLYLMEGRPFAAVMLAIYGAVVISGADNVIKPYVLHGQSKLHPLLALLSVLGGVQALGPIGILVGPMVVAFLQTLLKILHRELTALEQAGGGTAGINA